MQRHDLDAVSLFSGVAFVLVAAGYSLTHTTGVRLNWLLAVPALLVLVGAAVVVTVLRRMRRADLSDPVAAPEASTTNI